MVLLCEYHPDGESSWSTTVTRVFSMWLGLLLCLCRPCFSYTCSVDQGRSWTTLRGSGEWERCEEMFSSFSFLFQVSSYYLLVFIYFLPFIPLHQKSWRHVCYRHRLANSWVSPMFLREGTILSELLPNMHLPPSATTWKAQEAWVFPRLAPQTSKILLCVMKSSPLKPWFPMVCVPPDPVAPLPAYPWLTAAQPYTS